MTYCGKYPYELDMRQGLFLSNVKLVLIQSCSSYEDH